MTTMPQITCALCGGLTHSMELHLREHHPAMTLPIYQATFPDAPILSDYGRTLLKEREAQAKKTDPTLGRKHALMHEVFELPDALNKAGLPIPITVLSRDADESLIPDMNPAYIFDTQELKYLLSGFEANIPLYVWGHKGTGKTELFEQICARTNRPLVRVQHTVNTEESHIVGQWTVKDGATEFQFGPLPLAMMNGWTYLADEYDFALPNVLAVYQAVLEGKPLFIKEAPAEQRLIKPHPNFRFVATGNTNGTGDETGLYQGTSIQNSANYDRFGIVVRKGYLSEDKEAQMLIKQTHCTPEQAKAIVDFACHVRKAFDDHQLSDTLSPRTLMTSLKLGLMHGDLHAGMKMAFFNKLNTLDAIACQEYFNRYFGPEAA